jgi:Ca-activated chloride channel family protein
MNKTLIYRVAIYSLLLIPYSFSPASAQKKEQKPLTRIEFLFDDSQSMSGRWQTGTKIDIAKKLMSDLLDSLQYADNLQLGLRVFGHLKKYPPQDCDDSKLEVPFQNNNASRIKKVLNRLVPSGTTPIARSLELCGGDFPSDPSRNIIILITDGIEECNGDPCAVSLALQKRGIVLRPFIIGLGINDEFKKTFDCVGSYYDASNEETFRKALNVVISQALNSTTMQVNLLDAYGKPTETNVDMTFYDVFSGRIMYNFVHTINSYGNPDTLRVDPLSIYNIVVHTVPPIHKDSVKLTPGKHTIVGIDAPQGYLNLKVNGQTETHKIECIVRKHGELKTLAEQDFNTTEKYLTGKYDLEILTLPRIYSEDVDISQSKTTTVQIPQPGIITLLTNAPGYGSVYLEEDNKLTLEYTMDEDLTKETIVLQPGSYRVVYRSKAAHEAIYTVEKPFTVSSGVSSVVTVN